MLKFALAALATTMLCGTAQASRTFDFTAGSTMGTLTVGDMSTQDAGYYLLTNVTFNPFIDGASGTTFNNLSENSFEPDAAFDPMTGGFVNHYNGGSYPDSGGFSVSNGNSNFSFDGLASDRPVTGLVFDSNEQVSEVTSTGNLQVNVPTGAVPEPASWAMMMIGFGAAGFAMRRRKGKVSTTVRFA